MEVRLLVKSVSYNGDAKEWDEEAVEKLRHESNTLGACGGAQGRQTEKSLWDDNQINEQL